MENSILDTIKKLLGVDVGCTDFDTDIIVAINTALSVLTQLGVKSFSISGKEETWNDYIGEYEDIEMIKSYVHAKAKMLFDPPMSSIVKETYVENLKELESRISILVDPGRVE